MNDKSLHIIKNTKKWIEEFVIGINLCPFAKYGFDKDLIHYTYSESTDAKEILKSFHKTIESMENNAKISNSFLIINDDISFDELLVLSTVSQNFLEEIEKDGIYQLVDFHPELMFGDATMDDNSNYINRSPYPMIHILRTEEVENAIEHYEGDIEELPFQNIDKVNAIEINKLKKSLDDLKQN